VPDFIVNLVTKWAFSAQIAAVKVTSAIVSIVLELLEVFPLSVPLRSRNNSLFLLGSAKISVKLDDWVNGRSEVSELAVNL